MPKLFNGRTIGPLQSPQWNALFQVGWFAQRPRKPGVGLDFNVSELVKISAVLSQPIEQVEAQIADGSFGQKAFDWFLDIQFDELPGLCIEVALQMRDMLKKMASADDAGPSQ